jgi:hypothetical protein
MAFGVFIEGSKHDGKDDFHIIADQVAEVFVIPKVERPLCYLEVRASNRLGELMEQGFLNLGKFRRVHHLKNVFYLVEEHDLLGAVDLGPIA